MVKHLIQTARYAVSMVGVFIVMTLVGTLMSILLFSIEQVNE